MATFAAKLANESEVDIDWTACELIERVPGKVSGRPVVIGTRIMPDAILNSFELGEASKTFTTASPRSLSSRSSASSSSAWSS